MVFDQTKKSFYGMKRVCVLFAAMVLVVLPGRSQEFGDTDNNLAGYPPFYEYLYSPWVDSVMKKLNLEEQIAQLFLLRAYSNQGQDHVSEITRLIRKYRIGGLIFFQGGPERQLNLTRQYQEISDVPLLVALDGEWGLGMRLDSTLAYPRQMMLGAIENDSLIYRMGSHIGMQFRRLGMHVNFAPVVDINNNPVNPVINSRSFGEDPWNVTRKGLAYTLGLQEQHVLPTAKHFPGHGDTGIDSHHALPVIPFSRERLDTLELLPYRYMIPRGLGGIMVAHLYIPSLDTTRNRASTLSPSIVTGLLQEELGFRGLIVTDALDMKGVSEYDDPGMVDLQAFLAGNDIMLISKDVSKAIQTIKRSVRRGEIPAEEVERRCRKVLAVKYWAGLHRNSLPSGENLWDDLHLTAYEALRRDLVASAITLLVNRDSILPLRDPHLMRIASVAVGSSEKNAFQERMDSYAGVSHFNLPKEAPWQEFISLLDELRKYDLVIAGIHNTNEVPGRRFGITAQTIRFVDSLVQVCPVVADLFANPYSLAYFSNLSMAKAVIMSYEDKPLVHDYSAQLIFGGIPASGRLPVNASSEFRTGQGISLDGRTRLGYGIPEQEGMSSMILTGIDSLVEKAFAAKAIPGCQVLVARNGNIVLHKTYGYHTYQKRRPVRPDDIYDLASVTKITATLPLLMRMVDENKLSLSDSLDKFIPGLDTLETGKLNVLDILTHQARLNGWIPFYRYTFEPLDLSMPLYSDRLSVEYPFFLDTKLYMNRNYTFRQGIYQSYFSADYPFQVAENLYINRSFRDSMFRMIYLSPLHPKKEYRYSDLGFIMFQRAIENTYGEPMVSILSREYYIPLGAKTMGYNPLKWFPKEMIVPTENDLVFRRQLLQGYVHDPGAAMMDGIAGHAGLFSNAADLAKIMQMYLNGGTYGGRRFIMEETLRLFNTAPFREEGNRRGIGFDKPETDPDKDGPGSRSASAKSFGHSGFTGTYTWVDPEYNLLYVFLSNRVHPDMHNNRLIDMNYRTEILQKVYDSFGASPKKPENNRVKK